jgi:uncharacterized protein (TIGR03084 family)
MDTVVAALRLQHDELDRLIAPLDDAGWARPVPDCPDWTVADVVLHMAQTDELVVAGVTEGNAAGAARMAGGPAAPGDTVDDTVGRMVAHERGAPPREVLERWRAASSSLRAFFLDRSPRDPLPWVVGELPARTLATTRVVECWIHTRDVATALDTATTAGDQLWHVARLAWRTLPYAFARAGREPVAPESVRLALTAPDGSGWTFGPPDAATTVTGQALDFCLVAARRVEPRTTGLSATGPDADAVLSLVRTWA